MGSYTAYSFICQVCGKRSHGTTSWYRSQADIIKYVIKHCKYCKRAICSGCKRSILCKNCLDQFPEAEKQHFNKLKDWRVWGFLIWILAMLLIIVVWLATSDPNDPFGSSDLTLVFILVATLGGAATLIAIFVLTGNMEKLADVTMKKINNARYQGAFRQKSTLPGNQPYFKTFQNANKNPWNSPPSRNIYGNPTNYEAFQNANENPWTPPPSRNIYGNPTNYERPKTEGYTTYSYLCLVCGKEVEERVAGKKSEEYIRKNLVKHCKMCSRSMCKRCARENFCDRCSKLIPKVERIKYREMINERNNFSADTITKNKLNTNIEQFEGLIVSIFKKAATEMVIEPFKAESEANIMAEFAKYMEDFFQKERKSMND